MKGFLLGSSGGGGGYGAGHISAEQNKWLNRSSIGLAISSFGEEDATE